MKAVRDETLRPGEAAALLDAREAPLRRYPRGWSRRLGAPLHADDNVSALIALGRLISYMHAGRRAAKIPGLRMNRRIP